MAAARPNPYGGPMAKRKKTRRPPPTKATKRGDGVPSFRTPRPGGRHARSTDEEAKRPADDDLLH